MNNGNDNADAADIIDIGHVINLAKLDLSRKDLGHLGSELNGILGYIDIIKEADVSKISGILDELEYDKLVRGVDLNDEFFKDCRIDECKTDDSFDFAIVEGNAPSLRVRSFTDNGSDTELRHGFFVVPQIIE
ncbi:MAG TPA: aspartyl/glutamyl-tRNA amidotransferase subunit C [bacterium]|nr:aspartyl/glutamyl-tRNA amidotransferase subunit C [bacterium]